MLYNKKWEVYSSHFLGDTVETPVTKNTINIMASKVLGRLGCSTIQDTTTTTVTIPKDQIGARCAILIVGCNTYTPSVFVLSRTAVVGTMFQGTIEASAITRNNDGSITVTKGQSLSLYYRLIVMEY